MEQIELERIEEERRLRKVKTVIDGRLDKLSESVGGRKSDVREIRKEFWDDITMNFTNKDERMETFSNITQQAKLVAEQERGHKLLTDSLRTMLRLKQAPYFGRIDFSEAGETKPEQIYIGLASLIADDGESFLIYDWRAPISGMFYDYSPGPAQYEAPDGVQPGRIELKRQFVIKNGELLHMFDTDLTIGDAVLQQVLSGQAGSNMKNIVATIQKEQNRIIRNDTAKLLIVQGAAGSGKTSAALQRVAYLLYKHRGTLQADNIILFSPNAVFSSYISTVLPELGEANMRQITFEHFLAERFNGKMRIESLFDQAEYVLTRSDDQAYPVRKESIRFKSSPLFFEVMNRYLRLLEREGMAFTDIRFRGRTIIGKEEIAGRFYEMSAEPRISVRLDSLRKWLLVRLGELEKAERKKKWVTDEVELLDDETYHQAFLKLKKSGRFSEESFDDAAKERVLLKQYVVRKDFAPIKIKVKNNRFIDFFNIYKLFFTDPGRIEACMPGEEAVPQLWPRIAAMTCEQLEQNRVYYEDATPLLYLKESIEGFRDSDSQVRHVIVDEAQDYSPFQFAFLKRIFPRSKMTVLGDVNQAIFLQTEEMDGFSGLANIVPPEETDTIILEKSYRSTKEIIDFTRNIFGNDTTIIPFERHGQQPLVSICATDAERIEAIAADAMQLQNSGCATIGILCKTAEESLGAYEALKERTPLELVTKESAELRQGTTVMPAYLAKGIEFDAVIIYDASQQRYAAEGERKLFYTACTRAMHILHLYATGELTPFLR